MMKHAVCIFVLLICPAVADDILRPASLRFANRNSQEIPDFQRHVVPLLGRLGCNSAKCHGSFQGRGDFRLSLFGFDFQADHAQLNAIALSSDGPRLQTAHPELSLIVRKPTEQTDHEGGKRFAVDSWEHHLLLRWIEAGAQGTPQTEAAPSDESPFAADGIAFFTSAIQPVLEDHCFECHGFSSRKGGLSLATREGLLEGGESGPAIVAGQPEQSLLIAAIKHAHDRIQMPPSGMLDQNKITALEKWVQMGAPWPDGYGAAPGETDQRLVDLHYEPREILFEASRQTQQLRVIAHWDDGTREDVTCLTRFQTNNDAIATVDRDGLVKCTGEGDTHVVAFYDNGVAAVPVLKRVATHDSSHQGSLPGANEASPADHPVDRFVNAKLRKLGLVPSEICTDAEFLRRVSIDMTGTLPTPDEVTRFLEDPSNDKRASKVDELLGRPAYAAWWTNKLCDFTGCSPSSISSLLAVAREDGYIKATEWYDWIYECVARNTPYDELVAGIMLSDPAGGNDGMPHFWTRQSLSEPKDTAMSVAHAFLGIQLQCAECHKHPFDQWTQGDFNDFAKFFDVVTRTKRRATVAGDQRLQLLRSGKVHLQAGDDAREPVMEWMRDPQNPWFARAFVNRVWAACFHVGFVDPPDQMTPANPPSNPQLLGWLSSGFVESGYDMKWLHRQIATSETYQRSWKPNKTNHGDRRNFSRAVPRRIPAEVVYDALKQVTAATDQQTEVRTDLRRRAIGHLSMRMAGTHAMQVFGKPARSMNCDCERVNEPTLLQAIFTHNDPLVRMRIADSGWVIELEDAAAAGRQLDEAALVSQVWLRTVGRYPDPEESGRALQHLASADSTAAGIADLLWAMINTKEFLLNH
jgi:hypothetical protein